MQHLSAEEITTWVDGAGTDAERLHAHAHVEMCAKCRQSVDDERNLKAMLATLGEPMLPRSFVLADEQANRTAPLASPTLVPGTSIRRFEPILRVLSIAAVIALLVLGGAQLAGVGETDPGDSGNTTMLNETNAPANALEEQEPALARGQVREQGEAAAANAAPLQSQPAQVDTGTQVTDSGLTPLEITTIGVGALALASIAGWILIHYRAEHLG